jgi:hypothetical protein
MKVDQVKWILSKKSAQISPSQNTNDA